MDVAGAPQVYPVFNAERRFDTNGDGRYVFPNEVPTDPSVPGYSERKKISPPARVDGAGERGDADLRRRAPAPRRQARRPPRRSRRP